jgi:tyrosine-specific transport protein
VSFAYLALSYTLMIAYISKAGDLLGGGGAGPPTAFTAAVGAVLAAGPGAVDGVNRVATGALLALYAVIVGAGSLNADWTSLSRADWGAAPAAVPVVLLSLVFHDLVPVVVAQLRGDASKVRTALLVGGGIPLAMFAAWDAVALALADAAAPGADPLAALAAAGGPGLTAAVAGFSGLALATSALGNALGLTSTVAAELEAAGRAASAVESTSASSSDEDEDEAGASLPSPLSAALAAAPPRAAALALVLAPPLAAAVANPGSFVAALNAAGGYGMTALYGLLPPLMAWRLREQQLRATADAGSDDALPSPSALRLPGGRAALAGLTAAAAAVEVGRLAEDVGSSGGGGGMAAAVGDVVASVFGAF